MSSIIMGKVDLEGQICRTTPSPEDWGAESGGQCANRVGDDETSTEALAELSMLISVMYATLPQAEKYLSQEFSNAAVLIGTLAKGLGVTEQFWQAMEQRQSRAQAMVLELMVQTTWMD